jgi:LuxR family maltose regulon positive regulatory protein
MASTTIGPAIAHRRPDGRPGHADDKQGRGELARSHQDGGGPQVPQPRLNVLSRPRVTELIQRAAAHRVTLVCGPAGSGKTVACADWATASPAAGSIAWLGLDPGDREPGRLAERLLAAIASSPAMPADFTGELAAASANAFSLRLVQAAERLARPVTLVFDDIQALAGSAALADVDFLVRHGPVGLRLLLAGRYPAGLGVARLRVSGELAEIGGADLACTAQEADRYFAMLGIGLPAADRDELLARTRGWMTGLRLAALRAGPGSEAGRIPAITGDDPAVADYLWDEVLATQPAERRLFLLRTSITDRICGELADSLTGQTGGAAVLDQLSRENLMVDAITAGTAGDDGAARHTDTAPGVRPGSATADAAATAGLGAPVTGAAAAVAASGQRGAQYRYHPLLRDLLQAQLQRELPDEVPALAHRAACWQAARGFAADAIRNAARSGDWDLASRVLAEAGPAVSLPGPAAELEPVLGLFPADRCESDPAVAATLAAVRLRSGDCTAAVRYLDGASRAIGRCPPRQRRVIAPWLQALRLASAAGLAQVDASLVDESLALARRTAATASGTAEHQALGLLWCALGAARLATDDVADARQALSEAGRLLAGGRPAFAVRAHAWLAIAHAMHGDLAAAGGLAAGLRDDPATAQDPVSARLADLATAQLSWARDDAAAARVLLDRCGDGAAEPPCGPDTDLVISRLASAVRARLALGDGDLTAARELAARLRYPGTEPGHAADGPALAVLDSDIALRDGDVRAARTALASQGAGAGRADLRLAHARLLLADGDSRGALAATRPCLDGTASQITLHDQISALVTASVAHRRLGQADLAVQELRRALGLAEPHGSYRVFLDGGPAVRSALTVLIRPASSGAALTARILQRFDTCPARPADLPAAAATPLTSSELAVLRFLPSHMTNQEIAEALFLSINTVKTHLRSVYRKLSVGTRRQAISRAGRLGLL